MDTKILIEVEQLYRYYGHHLAVDAISFELSQGEVLGFLGPNGAGKSTTMQMITGNLAPAPDASPSTASTCSIGPV